MGDLSSVDLRGLLCLAYVRDWANGKVVRRSVDVPWRWKERVAARVSILSSPVSLRQLCRAQGPVMLAAFLLPCEALQAKFHAESPRRAWRHDESPVSRCGHLCNLPYESLNSQSTEI